MARVRRHRGSAAELGTFWLGLALGACCAVTGCASETAGRGDACTRTAQCATGLACIEGECSSDLAGLDQQGMVPMLMPEPGADGGEDGGADAAAADAAAVDAAADAAAADAAADAAIDAGGALDAAAADDDAG